MQPAWPTQGQSSSSGAQHGPGQVLSPREPMGAASGQLLLLLGLLLLGAMLISAQDAVRFGGIDLMPKVLGARALLAGENPYDYRTLLWQDGTPEDRIDTETLIY